MDTSFNFYIKDDVKYIIHFPEKWFPHIGNSGSINCEQCKMRMINNIFVFYCSECLINVYNYKRGTPDYFNLIINEVNFEKYIKLYYELLIKNDIYCYGCVDLLTAEDIKKGYDDNDKNILCYECKNFPDFENWPPLGY
jgi:hypothetical protein